MALIRCWALLALDIRSYVSISAWSGQFVTCLIPKSSLEKAKSKTLVPRCLTTLGCWDQGISTSAGHGWNHCLTTFFQIWTFQTWKYLWILPLNISSCSFHCRPRSLLYVFLPTSVHDRVGTFESCAWLRLDFVKYLRFLLFVTNVFTDDSSSFMQSHVNIREIYQKCTWTAWL